MLMYQLPTFLTHAVITLVGLAGLVPWAVGETPPPRAQPEVIPADEKSRKTAVDKLIEDRKKTIAALLALVRDLQQPDQHGFTNFSSGNRLWYAIKLLGDLRAEEAVEPLLDMINIPFSTQRRLGDPLGVQSKMFPAPAALIAIGKPASVKATSYLATEKSKIRRAFYVDVISKIKGPELGREMLRLASAKEKDPAKKARLKDALDLFDDADKPKP